MPPVFGTQFKVLNDTYQLLNPSIFTGGPWYHIATLGRGFREYMIFRHAKHNTTYIEIVDPKEPGLLKRIDDEEEWKDICAFARAAGFLTLDQATEILVADHGLSRLIHEK